MQPAGRHAEFMVRPLSESGRQQVSDYMAFGGRHWASAAIRNLLTHAGVRHPTNDQPLSEALCFGIAGGIAAGYSFSPSIPGHGFECGAGVSAVGRYRVYASDASFFREGLERLGADLVVEETAGSKQAQAQLMQGLALNRPVLVWCRPPTRFPVSWACSYGMYAMVVHGVDTAANSAQVADCAPDSITLPLDELAELREAVCSHRNRSLHFELSQPLDQARLIAAVKAGLVACAQDFLRPAIKTYSLPGLKEWSKLLTSKRNRKGWPKVYPGWTVYLALRDIYDSVETAAVGGGLFRPLYADFLSEAAELLSQPALQELAVEYRDLGADWSDFAAHCLDENIAEFAQTRELLQRRQQLWLDEGQAAQGRIDDAGLKLERLASRLQMHFPLDEEAVTELLHGLAQRLEQLYQREHALASRLTQCAGLRELL